MINGNLKAAWEGKGLFHFHSQVPVTEGSQSRDQEAGPWEDAAYWLVPSGVQPAFLFRPWPLAQGSITIVIWAFHINHQKTKQNTLPYKLAYMPILPMCFSQFRVLFPK